MSKINRVSVNGENGRGFVLSITDKTSFSDLRVSLDFELPWAKGSFEIVASEHRLSDFMRSITALNLGELAPFSYLSDEGNLEITVNPTGRGDAIVKLIGIPNMAEDDRIEFEVEGVMKAEKGRKRGEKGDATH